MMRLPLHPLRSIAPPGLLPGLLTTPAGGDEAPPRVVRLSTASDWPRLARGIRLPHGGRYTVRVWAPARQDWSLAADGQTLTLVAETKGDDDTPRWQVVDE